MPTENAVFPAASNDTHGIYGCGTNYVSFQYWLRAVNKNLVISSPSNSSTSRLDRCACGVGDYIVYCGSRESASGATDFYDNSNVKTTGSNPYGYKTEKLSI